MTEVFHTFLDVAQRVRQKNGGMAPNDIPLKFRQNTPRHAVAPVLTETDFMETVHGLNSDRSAAGGHDDEA